MRCRNDRRNYVVIAGLCQLPQTLKTVWSEAEVWTKVWSDLSKVFAVFRVNCLKLLLLTLKPDRETQQLSIQN